jgi:hypothetical protein
LKSQEKLAAKELKSQEKLAAKELKSQEKLAAKELKNQEKKELKNRESQEKKELKNRENQEKKELKNRENQEKKELKNRERHEIRTSSIRNIIQVAKDAAAKYADGFTAKQLTDLYISTRGRLNPYTMKIEDESYDITAAIRGIMEESSPSSVQHWFKYGVRKSAQQVAPWVFANKKLAIVNNIYGWKITTKEFASARRQSKGKWMYIENGYLAQYDWCDDKYGPFPTENILREAAIGRKIGVRKMVRGL